jgi:type III pantothenate kinase
MLLVVDIGNTNVTAGLVRDGALLATHRAATRPEATTDEIELLVDGLLRLDEAAIPDVSAIALASVVPSLTDAFEELATRRGVPLIVAGAGTVPIAIRVDRPAEVGADRLVNALAAQRLHGAPAVVVDFGTATTFDAVSAAGEYLGGAMAPGILISLDALVSRASKLNRVELAAPASVIGRSPGASMQAGFVFGYVGLVQGIVARMRAEIGMAARVIATGGLAELFAPLIPEIEAVDLHLTLVGLRLIHDLNAD